MKKVLADLWRRRGVFQKTLWHDDPRDQQGVPEAKCEALLVIASATEWVPDQMCAGGGQFVL